MNDCIFCKIAAGEIPAKIVSENEHLLAFYDIDPKAPTHLLIIPRRHVRTILDVDANDSEWWQILPAFVKALAALEAVDESGFRIALNCGADAGMAVEHIHFHLLGGRKMKWPPG